LSGAYLTVSSIIANSLNSMVPKRGFEPPTY
jgi:hypothetical protein